MPETITSVVDLIKPEVGGSYTTWGNRLNEDLDKLDAWLTSEHKMLSTSIQNGGNLTGTFTDYDVAGEAISPARNLSDESFRTMENLLLYADDMIDNPMVDIPVNRPGAMVPQIWVRTLIDQLFPIGTIIMWSGSTYASIPDGWCPCDGVRPTGSEVTPPNLMGRFVLAAYPDDDTPHNGMLPGQSYGTAGQFGHTHSITVNDTKLAVSQLPPHAHDHDGTGSRAFVVRTTTGGSFAFSGGGPDNGYGNANIASDKFLLGAPYLEGLGHNHTATSKNDNASQPYWAMLYIMKWKNLADAT